MAASLKVSSGTYGNATTDETSLVTNLIKYPEIGKKLIELYPRYTLTYLLEAAGRQAAEKVIGDSAFEWKVMGRYSKPGVLSDDVYTNGVNGDITAGQVGNLGFRHDTSNGFYANLFNPNDVLRLSDGTTCMVVSGPTGSGDGTNNFRTYEVRAIDAITNANHAAADVVGRIGNAFQQGSLASEVGQNYAYPDTYKNWLTLSRKKTKIMGSDLTDVTWIESNGSRLWYFTKEQQMTAQFMYELELMRWYGKHTYGDLSTAAGFPGDTGDVTTGLPTMGDGVIEQIDTTNTATYAAGALTEEKITEFIGTLSLNAMQSEGNVYVVFAGTQARIDFHRAMKDLIVAPSGSHTGGSFLDVQEGRNIALGGNFTEYNALGNKIVLAHCPVFDDDTLHNSISSSFNTNNESGRMVFMDFGTSSGVSNVELISKGAEGYNRNFLKKYVSGMVNPYDQNSMLAASGDDFFEAHVLSESGIIVRNPLSCGVLSNA